ncbi:HAD family hydrolase [Pleionea sp. CnH1-48]|uniref:HAD family hydrolase n=1 Tax=Pleionea sp. CnH1-48 TaxID=2954494 RepID=UPI002096E11B|nr:HAD family hydrolase [Pleionea sp. CnH1-48]MCO7225100.1 HAD family hydrolase [Pleionea sp. CnH1-48]
MMLLVLDLDNTLIDRDQAYASFMQQWLKEKAFMSKQQIEAYLPQIMRIDNHGYNEPLEACEKILRVIEVNKISAEQLWQDSQQLIDYIMPSDSLKRMLDRLALRYQLALLTNGSSSRQRKKIHNATLAPHFDYIGVSEEIGTSKPSTCAFTHILDAMGASAREAISVGDNIHNDIEPATKIGMKTIHIPPHSSHYSSHADITLNHIFELEQHLL